MEEGPPRDLLTPAIIHPLDGDLWPACPDRLIGPVFIYRLAFSSSFASLSRISAKHLVHSQDGCLAAGFHAAHSDFHLGRKRCFTG